MPKDGELRVTCNTVRKGNYLRTSLRYSKSMNKWLRIARKVARHGRHPSHQVGAVVVRGGSVLTATYNYSRPYGIENGGRHAEERALNNLEGRDFSGATIYVARYRGTMSRPCPRCMNAILASGIKKIGYVDWNGEEKVEPVSKIA